MFGGGIVFWGDNVRGGHSVLGGQCSVGSGYPPAPSCPPTPPPPRSHCLCAPCARPPSPCLRPQALPSNAKVHITVGHSTVMATVRFFHHPDAGLPSWNRTLLRPPPPLPPPPREGVERRDEYHTATIILVVVGRGGSANAETTPARAPAVVADRTQRPDATCEGKTG